MEKALGRPPRPCSGRHIAFSAESEGSSQLCAWMSMKNHGIASVWGKSRLYFTLDNTADTLSWAKGIDEHAKTSVNFEDILEVEFWSRNALSDDSDASTMDDATDSQCNSRSSSISRSSSKSNGSIRSRLRSLSPFKKAEISEQGVIIRTTHKSYELTCESKAQAENWLSALKSAIAKGQVLRSAAVAPSRAEVPPSPQESSEVTSIDGEKQADKVKLAMVETSPVSHGTSGAHEGLFASRIDSPLSAWGYPVSQSMQVGGSAKSTLGKVEQKETKMAIDLANPGACSNIDNAMVMEDINDSTSHKSCSPKMAHLLPEEPCPKKSSPSELIIEAPTSPQSHQKVDEVEERKVFDKRELRRRNRAAFEKQLLSWKEKHLGQVKAGPTGLDAQRVRVCVRKRPLFPHENEDGEFDVVTVRGAELIVHNCLTKADLRAMYIGHMGFHFARAFGEEADNVELYKQCAQPAVQNALKQGSATIFMFGQTGSGKTHTMQSILHQASETIFGDDVTRQVYLSAFEIAGKNLKDLQDPLNPTKELKIMTDLSVQMAPPGQLEEEQQGSRVATKVHGLNWCVAQTAADLLQLCKQAQEQRTTRATQVNKVSSRSHSVIRIGHSEDDIFLTLVDCAGSERNEDSTRHTAQDRKDATEINSTIFTLKECFRVMREGKGKLPPFRESLLTRVLADSFTNDGARVVAIGTISPASKDTEHSIETLKSLQLLQGTQMTFENREDVKDEADTVKHPRLWSEEEVRHWFGKAAEGRAEPWLHCLPKGTDGKMLVRMAVSRFVQLCGGNKELGDAVFKDLRQEMQNANDSRRRKP